MKYLSRVFLSATPLELLIFCTPNRYPTSYSYFNYTVAAQTTLYWYIFQLFLSATPSYSYQLLLLPACNRWSLLPLTVLAAPYCISYSYKAVISAATLSDWIIIITYSYQLLASTISFRCFYQSFVSALLEYSYKVLLSELIFK